MDPNYYRSVPLENHQHCALIVTDLLYSCSVQTMASSFPHKPLIGRLLNKMAPLPKYVGHNSMDGSVTGCDGCEAGSRAENSVLMLVGKAQKMDWMVPVSVVVTCQMVQNLGWQVLKLAVQKAHSSVPKLMAQSLGWQVLGQYQVHPIEHLRFFGVCRRGLNITNYGTIVLLDTL